MSVRDVGIGEGRQLRDAGYVVVDVREPFEWDAGRIPGALHIPLGEVPQRAAQELPDRDAPIMLYCRSGARSGRAAAFLAANGYTNVINLHASIDDWRAAGGDWGTPEAALTPAQERRYGRQILIPEVGLDGQRRLLEARVLIVGAGGLGSPAALYLAAAGLGTIGLVDDDVVEESNLQRQVLHAADRIGMAKVDSAELALHGMNPEATVVKHAERLEAGNVDRLISAYDLVIDGTDNLDTRYVVNDAAVRAEKAVIHGSIYRWDGQVTVFKPPEGPCYRCMHPVPPPDELAPSCGVAGVMGVLPGTIGMLQATEAIKLILGVGQPLIGRLLVLDALRASTEEIAVPRDPACPACGSIQPGTVEARSTAPAR